MLVLEDGQVATGDGSSVVYPGRAGVDPPARAEELIPVIRDVLAPKLVGTSLDRFRPLAEETDAVQVGGRRMHAALRWGISTALLDAVALARRVTKAEVLADEWGTTLSDRMPPLLGQSGQDWDLSLDRVIMRRIDAFHRASHHQAMWDDHPRALRRMRDRSQTFAPDYRLDIQLDINGFAGRELDNDAGRIVSLMADFEAMVEPLRILFASPVEMPDRESQIAKMREIRQAMKAASLRSELIADYFCASVEDHRAFAEAGAADYHMVHAPTVGSVQGSMDVMLDLKRRGIKPYLAGTGTSTDRSGMAIAHMAVAASPDLVLLTPGPGVDTAHSITVNEIQRILTLARSRQSRVGA
jgi:methylaspartate ammonia-lyase